MIKIKETHNHKKILRECHNHIESFTIMKWRLRKCFRTRTFRTQTFRTRTFRPCHFGPGRLTPDILDHDVSSHDILDLDVSPLIVYTRKFRPRTFWIWTFRAKDVSPPDFLYLDVSLPAVSDQVVSPPDILIEDVLPTAFLAHFSDAFPTAMI